jgi:hypothetical protein
LTVSRRLLALLVVLPLVAARPNGARLQSTDFARLIERLSEGGGFFNSDNLVSNETSYLHVLGAFRALGVRGGAFLGVGPEQGFSYIAEIRPKIAFLIDIRRDNLLLHLLLKAMFASARNRMEYLCLLYGRAPPPDLPLWTELELATLLDYLDRTPVSSALHLRNHVELMAQVARYGVPLTAEDRETLRRFHDEFASAGLDLQYSSRNRPPRFAFPTVRRLYLETDLEGNEASYLATEDRWRTVRALHRADRIVPVVGDLAGPKAVKAIGAYLREANLTVSAFYLSNVESYLFRYGTFPSFAENVNALPMGSSSVMVRSWFGRGAQLPSSLPGHFSTQLVQPVDRFLALTAQPDSVTYWMLVNDAVDLRAPSPVGSRRPPASRSAIR